MKTNTEHDKYLARHVAAKHSTISAMKKFKAELKAARKARIFGSNQHDTK